MRWSSSFTGDHDAAPEGFVPGGSQHPEGGQPVAELLPGACRAVRQSVAERAVRDADRASFGEPGRDAEERADGLGVLQGPKGGGVVLDDGLSSTSSGASGVKVRPRRIAHRLPRHVPHRDHWSASGRRPRLSSLCVSVYAPRCICLVYLACWSVSCQGGSRVARWNSEKRSQRCEESGVFPRSHSPSG